MSVRSAPYFWLVCDRCGRVSTEGSEYQAWATVEGAEEDADDFVGERGNHLCEDCTPHEPGWDVGHDPGTPGDPFGCLWCRERLGMTKS